MYLATIVTLMGLLPAASIVIEAASDGSGNWLPLVGKWFVFWASGVRLLLAGFSQTFRPSFTTRDLFHIKDPDASKIVVEVGFGNLAIGTICALSLPFPAWRLPAALCSALFFAPAGMQHVRNAPRGGKENIAMISDLLIAGVLAIYLAGTMIGL